MVNTRQAQGDRSSFPEGDDLELLINKVCTKFSSQLEEKLDAKIDKLERKFDHVVSTLSHLNKSVSKNKDDIQVLQDKVDALEQGRKNKCLRFCGISESVNEHLDEIILSFIIDKLNIQCEESDIDSVFRVGQHKVDGSSRTIIVKFTACKKRNEVYGAKKLLKGTPYTLYEDLSSKRFELLTLAKKKYGNNKAWSYGGNIYIWNPKDNSKIKILNKDQL